MIEYVIGLTIFLIVAAFLHTDRAEKVYKTRLQKLKSILQEIEGFKAVNFVSGIRADFIFAVDDRCQKIAFIQLNETKLIDFPDVVGVEIVEDDEQLFEEPVGKRNSGSFLSGETRAMSEGVMDTKTAQKKVENLVLRILVEDLKKPFISIVCFRAFEKEGVPTSDTDYQKGQQVAKEIKDIIGVILEGKKG